MKRLVIKLALLTALALTISLLSLAFTQHTGLVALGSG